MPAGWKYQKSKAYFAVIQLWWRTLGVKIYNRTSYAHPTAVIMATAI
jgi:hypothetical protein